MTHFTRAELERFRDDGGERDRFIVHLAACTDCRTAFAEVVRDAPVPEAPAALDPRDFVGRGHAAYRGRHPKRVPRLLWGAGLLAATGLAVLMLRPAVPPVLPPTDPATVRGSDIQLLAPVGAVRGPVEFRWSSPVAVPRYRVRVRDQEKGMVYEGLADQERLVMPAEAQARIQSDVTYSWTVEGLDAAGEVVVNADPAAFHVRR